MNLLLKYLMDRKNMLVKIVRSVEKENNKLPQGLIRVVKHNKKYQYYIRESANDKNGRYISIGEQKNAINMIQEEYNTKFIVAAKREIRNLEVLIKIYEKDSPETIYERMPEGKQSVIKPALVTKEEFLKNVNEYQNVPFAEDSKKYVTNQNIQVRSKSEVIIANLLDKYKIPYIYEKPLKLNNGYTVHPDFTIFDVANHREIYYEHLGLLDDVSYLNKAILKIRSYEESGYYLGDQLIITAETELCPLDIKALERKIKTLLL